MKAIGGRRRQIARSTCRTALLLGALGTRRRASRSGSCSRTSSSATSGSTFFAVDVGFGVDSAGRRRQPARRAAGTRRRGPAGDPPGGPRAAARGARGHRRRGRQPGCRRRALLRRVRFLPRTMQIGLRNVGRRRRRSLATAVMVALAVGNLLAVLGLAAGVSAHDARRVGRPRGGRQGARRGRRRAPSELIARTPGVAAVEPMFDRGDQACRQGRVHLGGPPADDVPLPDHGRALVHAGRGAGQAPRGGDRAQPRPRHGDARRRPHAGRRPGAARSRSA